MICSPSRARVIAVTAVLGLNVGSAVAADARSRPTRIERVWAAPAPDEPESIAADAGGAVVVGRAGEVRALAPSGEPRWQVVLGDSSIGPIAVSPVVVAVPVDGRVVALDRSTGGRRWHHDAAELRASAFGEGALAIMTASGALEILDAANGTTRWKASVSVDSHLVRARVWVAAGRVVAAWTDHGGAHLRAFDAATGVPIWADDAPEFASMPVVYDGQVVLAANDRRDGRTHVVAVVRSIAIADGATRWSRQLRHTRGYWAAVGAASGSSAVAVVDLDGRVTVLDARTGTVRWRRATGRRQYEADPIIVGGVFAMTTYGSGLTALGIDGGAVVENEEPGVVQTLVTIEASAAAGARLYLLVRSGNGAGGVWMLTPE